MVYRGYCLLVGAAFVMPELLQAYMLPAPLPPGQAARSRSKGSTKERGSGSRSKTDFYEVLGLSPEATYAEVKRAYRERAKVTHPDLSGDGDYAEFLIVKEAYQNLHSPVLRQQYDRKRAASEVAELGLRAAEIIVTDMALPLVREVAIPLVKTTLSFLVEPLLKKTIEGGALALDSFKKAAHARALQQQALEASRKLEQLRATEAQLRDFKAKALKQREQAADAEAVLQDCMHFERVTKQRLDAELSVGTEVRQRSKRLREQKEFAQAKIWRASEVERRRRSELDALRAEDGRALMLEETAEKILESTKFELEEAYELLRLVQLRVEAAERNYEVAIKFSAESRTARAQTGTQLEQFATALSEAEKALAQDTYRLEELKLSELELEETDRRHREAQRIIQTELGLAARAREAAQKELDKAISLQAKYEKQAQYCAIKLEKGRDANDIPRDSIESRDQRKVSVAARGEEVLLPAAA